MEFKINNAHFNKAVAEVSNAVSSKSTLPILTGIKIIAESNSLSLIGSNSDIIIERTIPNVSDGLTILEVFKTGSVVVSGRYLSEIIKKLPNDIYFEVHENQLVTIKSEEIVTKLNGLNASEYPSLPDINVSNNIRMTSDSLIDIIKQTVFAASKSETKPVLTGVNFSFQKDLLTCIATNSQRLSLRSHRIKSDLNGSFIVPSTSLTDFVKLFGGYTTEIDLIVAGTFIVFKSNAVSLYSRLIDGNYPNTSSLLREQSSTTVTLDTRKLLKGIDRACIFASESKNTTIKFQVESESKIKISSKSSEMGNIEEMQSIKNITGEQELSVTLDGSFMLEALKVIKEDEVRLCFKGSMRPILILPIGNETHLQLISPVRSY